MSHHGSHAASPRRASSKRSAKKSLSAAKSKRACEDITNHDLDGGACTEGASPEDSLDVEPGPIYDVDTEEWRCPAGSSEAYMEKWALLLAVKEDCEGQEDPDFSDTPRRLWHKYAECPAAIEFAKTPFLPDERGPVQMLHAQHY